MRNNPAPTLSEFKLEENALRDYGIMATIQREKIKQKADIYRIQEHEISETNEERTRHGMILSVASRHQQVKSAKELRLAEQ